jgi:hypothetical protein
MAQGFTPGLISRRSHAVVRLRELPIPGKVLVTVGQKVRGSEVVGRADLPGELHIVRAAEQLGIEPHEVMKGLRAQIGEHVTQGQILCEHRGLFGLIRSRCLSPEAGILEFVSEGSGHFGIRGAVKPVELTAYAAGTVVAVEPGKSVSIEMRGAVIQGIFGIGGERQGRILCVASQNGGEVTVGDLPAQLNSAILIIKGSVSLEVVEAAALRGATGLVCGSIDDKVLASYLGYDLGIALTGDENVPMVIMITEGFGDLEMSPHNFALFGEFDGKDASINGTTQVRAGAIRPEVLIPHSMAGAEAEVPMSQELKVGLRVRMIRVPYFGAYGLVEELPAAPEKVASGAVTRVLRVRLESGEKVSVPRANVEIANL